MTKLKLAAVVIAALVLAGPVMAGDEGATPTAADDVEALISLIRQGVRDGRADVVAKTMELNADEANAFWPVYKKYETELTALGDERLAIIRDFAAHYDAMDDAKAKELLEKSFGLNEKTLALQKKYMGEFLKVLPAKVVARFFQIENRLNMLIGLELSSEIPLVY